ncbi:FAD-binding oxidoreductase [Mycobacterium intermedium]|uniref:FAD-binding oxidoreductase n=1 Tax=Mycobacterium intermedium TaxID=28445 RepID=A0A1E3SFC3_MYCIE|nr:FAD-binding oxidoreductase [Mycobacterium intermedium]MCV6966264.1 FAD-binding oxidoreductase [Mycobacterium intermedium]ODR00866.1 FAD-linked oxidase [Mycobacterium intermedium]OPE52076.1 FAD-binding oxidoreductase [Mycobacterium intermedium]ORB09758.1 FAD-binding oxidoreductase [Mycobacterium intermedium]
MRSWWGWGTVEDALSPRETRDLEARVSSMLPGHDLTDHRPPDPNELGLPPPRVTPPRSLGAICSDNSVDRAGHARGKAFRDVARNLQGRLDHVPDLIVRPRREQDVVDVLDWCTREGIAVIPYGGGSSVVGGVEPRFDRPAVTVDVSVMSSVVEVDRISRAARIQAGALGPWIERQLRKHDLTLRHFPQSFAFSSLGGWLATRAGGHFATLYTHIDDLTESMRVVTPAGVSESRRLPGSGAGPSSDRLFLGSEGALGIITEAWMRLQVRPRWQVTASIAFDNWAAAVAATRTIAQAGLFPANCRLLDPAEAFLNAGTAVAGGLLVLAFESADHPIDPWLDRAVQIAVEHRGTVISRRSREAEKGSESTEDASATWRTAFLRMPYQRDALARRGVIAETFETACTWTGFDALHAAVTEAARTAIKSVCGTGVVTCRFTHVYPDGPAPYYGIYAGGRWGSLDAQWDEIKAAVSEAISATGGTITHHHAVGRDHRPWYDRQRPDPFAAALRATKSALDPAGILNPGVLLDP